MAACGSCRQENPPIAKFCLACGSPLAAEPPPPAAEPRQERKLVTGVFVDVVGSTARAETLDPEDVRAMLAPYHARARAELERFGGTVEKFIGDAVFALFGAPVAHEDDAERAVRAAFALLEAIAELNREDDWLDLHVRVGVHTGEALVMLDAKPGDGDWMAAGDIVNTAARIQSAAPTDGILVGELTHELTAAAVEYDAAEPIAAKGKAEPVPVWVARSVRDAATRRPTRRLPLVGREAELTTLAGEWQAALRDRRARVATVVGAPGMGKTRLLAEVAARARADGRAYVSRCLPYGEGITYWPVTEILKSAAGILQSDSAETDAAKLGALLDALPTSNRDELRSIAAALAALIGSPTTPRGTYSTGEIGQDELHWGIRRTLQLLSARTPLLIVVEDVHWAEPTLLKLIRFLASDDADAPILVACSARPEFAQDHAEFLALGTSVDLEPLRDEDGRSLLARLVGSAATVEHPAAANVLEVAGGNPLFLEELVRTLVERGSLSDAGWGGGDDETLAVPTNLQALVAARLDQLTPREKEVAQHASVVGQVFWPGAVAYVGGRTAVDESIREAVAVLDRRDFVRANPASSVAGEDEYAFKHILIRDVAYRQMPKGHRIPMHVRFSEWLRALPGTVDEFVELVAWHLEQACRLAAEVARPPAPPPVAEAIRALTRAAEKAERLGGLREAERYYDRAQEVAGAERTLVPELLLRRATIRTALGELKGACEDLVQAERLAHELGRQELRCAVLIALAEVDRRQGRVADARARLVESRELCDVAEDPTLGVRSRFVLAALRANSDGEADAALDDLGAAVAIAERIGRPALLAEGRLRTAALLMNLGRLAEAEAELERCLSGARAMGSHTVEAEATAWLAAMKYYLGDPATGNRLALQAAEWLERTGDSYFLVQNLVWLAAFALLEDDAATAERHLRRALPTALEIGGWIVIQVYRYLVEALVALDRLDEARELAAFAARNLPEEDVYARTELLLAEASVATAAGEATAAGAAFAEALRLLEDLNMPTQLGETRLALGRALRTFGDVAGARVELERARGAFARMGARTLIDLIDADLRALDEDRAPAVG
ncbi:MAG TPA: adenylate/guanylate cyclase domain-containing protein [Gaiellaceae bacterium]|nr:adenylate/guanylate cyclase domain-containing protein [Gaiellaceae bacterium]